MRYKWSFQIKMRGTPINPLGFEQGYCKSISQNRHSHIFYCGYLSKSKENKGLQLNLPFESMLTYFRFFFGSQKTSELKICYKSEILPQCQPAKFVVSISLDISSFLLLRPCCGFFFYLQKIGIKFNGHIIIAVDSLYRVLLNLFLSLSASLAINCSSMK